MQTVSRNLQTIPKMLILSYILKQKPALEQVCLGLGGGLVFRGKFDCKNGTCISRQLSYHQEFKLNSTAKNTLQSRILEYFRTNSKYSNMTSSPMPRPTSARCLMQDDSPLKNMTDLTTLKHSQLAEFIDDIQHESFIPSMNEMQFDGLVSFLDEECSCRIKIMCPRDLSTMLDAWMHWIPHRITHLQFYNCFLRQMKTWLSAPQLGLPVEDLIKLTFYTGLKKKSQIGNEIMQLVTDVVEENIDLQSLSIEELCILTNAFYKIGFKITSGKLLATINDAINKNLDILLEDPALLTTLVKALRHAQNYDYEVLDTVSSRMLANESAMQHLGFTAKSHILAWYANTLYARLDILYFLVESSQKDLTTSTSKLHKTKKSDHLSISYRSKDLSRFLWSLSHLNYKHTSELCCVESTIIPELTHRFQSGFYVKKPHEIIDSLLSLWILGFKAETLLAEVVSSKNLAALGKENKLYYNSRLALLLTCASIESPGVLSNEQLLLKDSFSVIYKPNLRKYMSSRPQLKKVYSIVRHLSDVLKASSVSCEYVIPHLNIAGIKVKTKSRPVYVEVLDPTVCLYKSGKPYGIMQLKLRLMESLCYQVIVIENHEIEKRNDDLPSLYEYIEEKIVSASQT